MDGAEKVEIQRVREVPGLVTAAQVAGDRRLEIEAEKLRLPEDHRPYIDKYFLRSNEILKAEGFNPFVRAQVVIRSSEGEVFGINQALAILDKYSDLAVHGGRVYALREGAYCPKNTALLVIEAPIQDIIELETMYLGVIAAATTEAHEGNTINFNQISERMFRVREAAGRLPIMYFGARHWSYRLDAEISHAAFMGGAGLCSTDNGAATFGSRGVGTIPHVLENIMAYEYGRGSAVREAAAAFDRVIDPSVPRISLIDYRNREVDDAIESAVALDERLYAVRLDTCGENLAQGAYASAEDVPADSPLARVIDRIPDNDKKYWFGNGVTVSGAFAVRQALNEAGYSKVKMVLTSGFADPAKVAAFMRASELLGVKLCDELGVGGIFQARTTKMDIVAVAETREGLDASPISKAGRRYRPNPDLQLVLGE